MGSADVFLNNNKVGFSYYTESNKSFIICYSNVGSFRILYIEDASNGNREFTSNFEHLDHREHFDEIKDKLLARLLARAEA